MLGTASIIHHECTNGGPGRSQCLPHSQWGKPYGHCLCLQRFLWITEEIHGSQVGKISQTPVVYINCEKSAKEEHTVH